MRHVLRITFPDSCKVRVRTEAAEDSAVKPAPVSRKGRTIDRTGGKPPGPKLLKAVKLGTMRHEVLTFCAGGVAIAAALERFGISRANLVMHFVAIHREHGIGYEIAGGKLTPLYPKGGK